MTDHEHEHEYEITYLQLLIYPRHPWLKRLQSLSERLECFSFEEDPVAYAAALVGRPSEEDPDAGQHLQDPTRHSALTSGFS